MAKPNLTSIFTSTNQYSVLKLLKALCDAVDNIDYADNTEFTNFKEQVNTAVASLISTDNSLQGQIDSNLNSIGDINNQISVIERPDANTTVVNKGITIKDNGDVTVGRNLEVGGTTKLMSGLEPIHTYSTPVINSQSYDIDVYIEKYNNQSDTYGFMGILRDRNPVYDNSSYLVIGSYGFSYDPSKEGMISDLYACGFEDFRINDSGGGKLREFKYSETLNYLGGTAYLTTATGQAKLYRHIITLSAQSSADGTCRLEWISSNKLQCSSLQDLRKILNNPQMQSYVASNPSGDLFGVVISASTAQFKKAGTTQLVNITRVSDTVTPL